MLDHLGENLARRRTARGLTQEELAAASAVSVDTISRLERGARRAVRGGTLSALARALDVTPADLIGMRPAERDSLGADQLRRTVHGNPDRAEDLLRVASAAAARDGQDRTGEAGVFGPRVAAMQAVDQAVRTGQPDQALNLARRVPRRLVGYPPSGRPAIGCIWRPHAWTSSNGTAPST